MSHPSATLLIVDDDAMNRDALSRRLSRTGYTVLTAENGPDALALVSANRVDAVLLDVMMPGMSGLDTLRHLREARSVSDLPVIMVTAKDGSHDVVEALDLGANDYVTKPIDYAVALARIRAQVTARRADPLTALPNRVLFMERLNRLLQRSRQPGGRPFAVFFLDVDRFKVINDSMGHAAGDELLVGVARRLEKALRGSDGCYRADSDLTLARMGGDEFTILLDGVGTADQAQAIAERLRTVLLEPFEVQGREVVTSVSIGIVVSADRYVRAEEMVRDADTAMYRAKELGKGRCEVFDTSLLAAAEARLQIESDLRHAIERGQLVLHYQPVVSLVEGRLFGFEALLRWEHPTRGLIPAAEFVPTAEETGLIVPIGRWVLTEACRQVLAWDHEYPDCRDLTISVNLSARQCMQPGLVTDVERVLQDSGIPPRRVKLEIAESIVLENADAVARVLHDLRALGVQLGLDDFGMGYTALTYLERFPFDTIKIDRTFVSAVQNGANAEIIRALVSVAEDLNMNVTAEGVETGEQRDRLRELACGFGQGFYFHHPLTSQEARAILKSRLPPSADPAAPSRP
jgi:diguanylate cyclase (GGDEF)-like protein